MKLISSEIVPNGVAEPIYAWDISQHMLTAIGEVVTSGATAEDALANAADAINPVSYTHLDVYKRQMFCIGTPF